MKKIMQAIGSLLLIFAVADFALSYMGINLTPFFPDGVLPISYWLFGFVYSFLIAIFLIIITRFSENLVAILILPWTIFWAVGCWRAADKYKGLMLWSVLSKISIVLSIIQGLASIVAGV